MSFSTARSAVPQHRALGRRADERAVAGEDPARVRGRRRLPFHEPSLELVACELDVEPLRVDVGRHGGAVAHGGERSPPRGPRSPARPARGGPPRAAPGATWPTMRPLVAPENRPSVTSATVSPSP